MVSPVEIPPGERRPSGAGFISVSERELDATTTQITVEGELDLATAPRLKWPLLDSVKAGKTRLLIDLMGVSFIDSTALSVLVAAHRKLPAGARMAIAATNQNVLRIFVVAGLDAAFDIFPTVEEARAHLGDGGGHPADIEEWASRS
ncbi:MAG: STAS domain-containing protein [Acidobacteriota bacterium]|nr:STAS domain-containing protein [Acidobacteriota bacterium]